LEERDLTKPDSEPHPAPPRWVADLAAASSRSVAITGGAGRLGTRLADVLRAGGHRVTVLDVRPPPTDGVRFVACDVRGGAFPRSALAGMAAVVHLAALHGPDLARGASRRDFWPVNVRGTQAVLEAARAAGVSRFIMAGSTSVYGPAAEPGRPCRVLDETTPAQPSDVYDLTKLAAECLVRDARAAGLPAATLRLGRFFFGSRADYHLRKLSTGLDVWDACQAFARVLCAPAVPRDLYCVVSDLAMPTEDRKRLGLDAVEVLRRRYPRIVEAARGRGIELPARVGKAVVADALRRDFGYSPERDLRWAAERWLDESDLLARNRTTELADLGSADLFPLAT
jgi:nucleoside-diphosphate-sugar epimerase